MPSIQPGGRTSWGLLDLLDLLLTSFEWWEDTFHTECYCSKRLKYEDYDPYQATLYPLFLIMPFMSLSEGITLVGFVDNAFTIIVAPILEIAESGNY